MADSIQLEVGTDRILLENGTGVLLLEVSSGVTGTVAVTQADQTSTASAVETFTGTVAVTQAAQTSSATGVETITGTSATTQAAQTSTASGVETITGTSANTQADQTSTASGLETITGTSANTQADQTSTASGTVANPVSGTVVVTQDDQTSTANAVETIIGSSTAIQADQTSTTSGTVANPVTGTVAVTQADQTSTATAVETFTGSVAVSQDAQTPTASGLVANPVTGTVAVTQADQDSSASGSAGAYPVVASLTQSVFNTATTSHLVAMPAVVDVGNLLVVFFSNRTDTVATPSGWTLLHTTANRLSTFNKIADGSEGGTTVDFVTTLSRKAVAHTYRVTGWHGTTAPEVGTAATGTSTSPDPPSLTPSWGAADDLWLTAVHAEAGVVSAYPSSYTNGADDNTTGGTSSVLGTARRELNATSEDPGTFTISTSAAWVTQTVAIRPVAVAAPVTGTVAVTQGDQTAAAVGVETFTGTAAAVQDAQTSSASGVETITGTSAAIQSDQSSTANGTLGISGTAAVGQADQTSTATGNVVLNVTGTVAVVQQDQFSTASGIGGMVIFWSPNPVGYTKSPVSQKELVGYVKGF